MEIIKDVEKLSPSEVAYWVKYFDKNLKFGSEIELDFVKKDRVEAKVSALEDELGASFSISNFKNGVHEVKKDGSLSNGVEITTVGRDCSDFISTFLLYKNIIDKADKFKIKNSPYTSWHNHVLLTHSSNASPLEIKIPKIIVHNFLCMLSRYIPALWYMTSTGEGDWYTRYNYFCKDNMKEYNQEDLDINLVEGKYTSVNSSNMSRRVTEYCVNSIKDVLDVFHLELRFPDGSMYPMQMATFQAVVRAMIMYSLKMSKFGVTKYEVPEELYSFKNEGDGESYEGSRKSNIVDDDILEGLKDLTKELLDTIKNELFITDKRAVGVVEKIALKPPFMLYKEGYTNWKDINDFYEDICNENYVKPKCDINIMKVINEGSVKVDTEEEWIEKVSEKVSLDRDIKEVLDEIKESFNIHFFKGYGYIEIN